jgi:hypothetical protein
MTAATAAFNSPHRGMGSMVESLSIPVAASTTIYKGTIVAINSAGNAIPALGTTFGLRVIGRASATADNASGAAAAINVDVERGCFRWNNSAGTGAITAAADIGKPAFCVDDNTVSRIDSGIRSRVGIVVDVDSSGVWVDTTRVFEDMAYQDIYLVAGADLSAKQYYFVKNSSGTAILASATAEDTIGVLQNAPASSAIAIIRVYGRTSVIAAGTVNAGTLVTTTSAGKSATITATSVSGATVVGSYAMGRALTAGTTDTAHQILLHPMGVVPTTAA